MSEQRLQPIALLNDLGILHAQLDVAAIFAGFSRDRRRSTYATSLWMALPQKLGCRRILALGAAIFHPMATSASCSGPI